MDTQVLLVIIIALLSVNLIFVGVYIVMILKEVRRAVAKVNDILESASEVSSAVAKPIVGASGAISAFTEGVKAFKMLKSIRSKRSETEVEEED